MEVDDDKYEEYIRILLKNNRISPNVMVWLNYETMSENYGWTPEQIDRQDPNSIDIYMAILGGKAKRKDVNMGKQAKRKLK